MSNTGSTNDLATKTNNCAAVEETSDHIITCSNSNARYVIVRGIRYVVPYLKEQEYSVRLNDADDNKSITQVLALRFDRRQHKDLVETEEYFRNQILHQHRVKLRRSKTSRHDTGPFTAASETVVDPDMVTKRNDVLQVLQHVHERCTLYRGPLITVPMMASSDSSSQDADAAPSFYRAIFKPAGLPVINNEGNYYASVAGMLKDNYVLGHRLDLPVSGVLLVGKGKKRAQRLTQALSPSAKQSDRNFLKAYLARCKGGQNMQEDNIMTVRRKLVWDNRNKKAIVIVDDETTRDSTKTAARDTITRVQRLSWDDTSQTSLVRVELVTGARQQIRGVLASMGMPIVGDVKYYDDDDEHASAKKHKGEDQDELRLFGDDSHGTLLTMLLREKKEWCDKCRWQIEEAKQGGTRRGTEQLTDSICLLSYHYRIPSLGIDAKLPDDMLPDWAKMTL